MTYDERRSVLPGAFVWRRVSDGEPARVLPDGCIDLLWDGEGVSAAGPDTTAKVFEQPAGHELVGLRFAPGWAPWALRVPAIELRDARTPLDAVWAARVVRNLEAELAATADAGAVLERVAARQLTLPTDAALIDAIGARAKRGDTVDAIAHDVGLSTRQLRRRCVDAFGYGPKLLGRVFRLRRALSIAQRGSSFATAAATAGYADQAHLARDARDLGGAPLRELLASR